MTTYELKVYPTHFAAVQSGAKRAEIRRDDRGYAVGDVLVLREFEPGVGALTGRYVEVRVTHVLRGFEGLAPGFAALSIEPLQPSLFNGIAGMF